MGIYGGFAGFKFFLNSSGGEWARFVSEGARAAGVAGGGGVVGAWGWLLLGSRGPFKLGSGLAGSSG